MLVTQAGSAAVALVLAGVTFAGLASLSSLYVLAALGAAIGSFDLPARQSIVPLLVPRDHLSSAISLNAIMIQAASVAGPAAAGFLIVSPGLAAVYLLNALSYGFVILAIVKIPGVEQHGHEGSRRPVLSMRSIGEGFHFVFSSPIVRATMLLDFFATFFSSARTLLPIFAEDILGVGPEGYGWLYAAPAAGGLMMATVMVAAASRIERRGAALLASLTLYGIATVGFGVSRSFWVMFSCLALTGAAEAVSIVIRNVVRQLETPDRLRGRMSAINMLFFQGGPRLGELEAGAVAQWLGAPLSVAAGGIGCLVATGCIALATPELRRYSASRDRAPSHTA
jgi:MFS family permease